MARLSSFPCHCQTLKFNVLGPPDAMLQYLSSHHLHCTTLLFEKLSECGEVLEKFFACAACRDRKDCSFYMKYDSCTPEKIHIHQQIYQQSIARSNHFTYQPRSADGNRYCTECDVFVPSEICSAKSSHTTKWKQLSQHEHDFPTKWIDAKRSNQTNAQYFFAGEVLEQVTDTLKRQEITDVLCIGAPSLHEHIISMKSPSKIFRSFLLDLDVRLRQFYKDFAYYNMFNHHFFDNNERDRYSQFLRRADRLALICDPPYGGLLEALNHTLDKISTSQQGKPEIKIVLFFPYYMEHLVTKHIPQLQMSDYKVNYSNHSGYRGGPSGKSRGSPARIYTNIPLKRFVLLPTQGYRFCKSCEKYIAEQNIHCSSCDKCTTKDGKTYKHCDLCDRCVKPSWYHCSTCNACVLHDHDCLSQQSCADTDGLGCFYCGDRSHKHRRCKRGRVTKRQTSSTNRCNSAKDITGTPSKRRRKK